MGAMAAPLIPPIVEGIIYIGGALLGVLILAAIADRIADYIKDNLGDAVDRARECRDCNCPDCVPPRGTVGIQVHWCPPSRPHAPCPSHHVHFLIQQQNPNNCQCFWDRNARRVLCLDPGDSPSDFDPRKLGPNIHVL